MHPLLSTSDLHVLGTPPAFILSQDQTLMFNLYAHPWSFNQVWLSTIVCLVDSVFRRRQLKGFHSLYPTFKDASSFERSLEARGVWVPEVMGEPKGP